eukprot:gene2911-3198_t
MSFIKDFFSFEVRQTLEQPAERAKSFEDLLEGRQEVQEAQRIYADMSIKPKYRYQHLRMNPFVSTAACFGVSSRNNSQRPA